jgi:hypothetical protein
LVRLACEANLIQLEKERKRLFFYRKRHDYAQYGRFDHPFDAFHEFFGGEGPGGGFRFKFQSSGGNGNAGDGAGQRIYHKQSITSKAYWNTILPNR